MAFDRAALLKKIAAAKSNGGGVYIQPGQFILEVENILFESKYGGSTFIVEFIVRESISTEAGKEANKVGTKCSSVDVVDKPGAAGDAAAGNVKAFVLGLYGLNAEEVSEAEFLEAVGAITEKDQPAKGMLIGCTAFTKPKKTKPGEFLTAKRWTTVPQDADQIAARRAAQEKAPAQAPAA
jgi:hypothetical protein